MPLPLRVLIISDGEDDALRLIDELRASDYVPTYERVNTAAAFREALVQRWDVILAAYESVRLGALASTSKA